jgi:hypothetical protein
VNEDAILEFMLSLLEGYGLDEAEAMEIEPAPHTEDWRGRIPRLG